MSRWSAIPTADGIRARAVVGTANPVNPQRPVSTGIPLDGVPTCPSAREDQGSAPPTASCSSTPRSSSVTANGNPAERVRDGAKVGLLAAQPLPGARPRRRGVGCRPRGPAAGRAVLRRRRRRSRGRPERRPHRGRPRATCRPPSPTTCSPTPMAPSSFDTPQLLGEFNRATAVQFRAFTPPYFSESDNDVEQSALGGCGERSEPVTIVLNRPEPQPADIDLIGSRHGDRRRHRRAAAVGPCRHHGSMRWGASHRAAGTPPTPQVPTKMCSRSGGSCRRSPPTSRCAPPSRATSSRRRRCASSVTTPWWSTCSCVRGSPCRSPAESPTSRPVSRSRASACARRTASPTSPPTPRPTGRTRSTSSSC